MNGSSCVLKFIWFGIWWLEVYRMTTKHMVKLRSYVNNLSYHMIAIGMWQFHTLRPRKSGRHFSDDIFKCISFNEEFEFRLRCHWNLFIGSSNIPALVQTMGRRRPGFKPLSEPIVVNLVTHICITWPQWDKKRVSCICKTISYRIWIKFEFKFKPKLTRDMSYMLLSQGLAINQATRRYIQTSERDDWWTHLNLSTYTDDIYNTVPYIKKMS